MERSPLRLHLALAVCLIAVLVGLAGQAGRWSERFDVINFGAPAWMSVGLLAALLLLWGARFRYQRYCAVATALALALIWFSLAAPAARRSTAGDCPSIPLRVIQFNVRRDNPDIGSAIAWIAGSEADIVLIEEATDRLGIVKALGSRYPYAAACVSDLRCSTVILSRHPFLASGGLARQDPENRKGLSAAWARVGSSVGPFTVIAAHLSRPWPWHHKLTERAELAAFVRAQGGDATLVGGDFNLPSRTFQLRQLTKLLGLGLAPNRRSWPAIEHWPPAWAIDHLFLGTRWSVERLIRGLKFGSDHYPLLAELRFSGACAQR